MPIMYLSGLETTKSNFWAHFLGFSVPRGLVRMAPGRLATSRATTIVAVRPACDGGRSKMRWPGGGPSTVTCDSSL